MKKLSQLVVATDRKTPGVLIGAEAEVVVITIAPLTVETAPQVTAGEMVGGFVHLRDAPGA